MGKLLFIGPLAGRDPLAGITALTIGPARASARLPLAEILQAEA